LPINSGLSLSSLQSDSAFNTNVTALVELSPWRLWDVVASLGSVLEELSSKTATTATRNYDNGFMHGKNGIRMHLPSYFGGLGDGDAAGVGGVLPVGRSSLSGSDGSSRSSFGVVGGGEEVGNGNVRPLSESPAPMMASQNVLSSRQITPPPPSSSPKLFPPPPPPPPTITSSSSKHSRSQSAGTIQQATTPMLRSKSTSGKNSKKLSSHLRTPSVTIPSTLSTTSISSPSPASSTYPILSPLSAPLGSSNLIYSMPMPMPMTPSATTATGTGTPTTISYSEANKIHMLALPDPPPLDENLARYLVSILMGFFQYQHHQNGEAVEAGGLHDVGLHGLKSGSEWIGGLSLFGNSMGVKDNSSGEQKLATSQQQQKGIPSSKVSSFFVHPVGSAYYLPSNSCSLYNLPVPATTFVMVNSTNASGSTYLESVTKLEYGVGIGIDRDNDFDNVQQQVISSSRKSLDYGSTSTMAPNTSPIQSRMSLDYQRPIVLDQQQQQSSSRFGFQKRNRKIFMSTSSSSNGTTSLNVTSTSTSNTISKTLPPSPLNQPIGSMAAIVPPPPPSLHSSTQSIIISDSHSNTNTHESIELNYEIQNVAEFTTVFKALARPVQMMAAVSLRKAIWNWIETHPEEFAGLYTERKKMDAWLDAVRKGLRGGNAGVSEVSALCLTALCRASTFVDESSEVGGLLRSLAGEIECDIMEKIFPPLLSKHSTPTSISGPSWLPSNNLNNNIWDEIILNMDQGILTEAVTTFFRLQPVAILPVLVEHFMDNQAPGPYRVAVVRGIFDVVSEERPFPWNPSMDASVAIPLRTLFMEHAYKEKSGKDKSVVELKTSKKPGSFLGGHGDRRVKKTLYEEATERYEILNGILKIWSKCPILAVARETTTIGLVELRSLFQAILSCLHDSSTEIRQNAGFLLRVLLSPDFICAWDGSTPDWRVIQRYIDQPSNGLLKTTPSASGMFVIWRITSQVIGNIAEYLLELKPEMGNVVVDEELVGDIMNGNGNGNGSGSGGKYVYVLGRLRSGLLLLRDLLSRRNTLLRSVSKELAAVGNGLADRVTASVHLESLFLVLLCCSDNEISSMAAQCIGLVVDEICLTDLDAQVYREIKELYSSGGFITGQRALQKKIRNIFVGMNHVTAGTVAAWDEVYRRWRVLCMPAFASRNHQKPAPTVVLSSNPHAPSVAAQLQAAASVDHGSITYSHTLSEDLGERQNYTGLLCALAASSFRVSIKRIQVVDHGLSRRPSSGLSSSTPTTDSGYSRAVPEIFISELVALMVCDNVVVREYVKELIGNVLNSSVLEILLAHCESMVEKLKSSNEGNISFLETFLSVLRLILERDDQTESENSKLSASSVVAATFDFGSLLLTFVQYLNRLEINKVDLNNPMTVSSAVLRNRMHVSLLADVLFRKREVLVIRQDTRVRNNMLDILIVWISQFTDDLNTLRGEQLMNIKLVRDVNIACMKALVTILKNLPLQPSADTVAEFTEKVQISASKGDELVEPTDSANGLKAIMYNNYSTFFLQLLEKSRHVQSEELRLTDVRAGTDNTGPTQHARETIAFARQTKDLAVMCLSNLLSANIEVGLKYSLSLGYHEDLQTRSCFLEVLYNIIQNGDKEQFDSVGAESELRTKRYQRLVELVTEDGFDIVAALAVVSDIEEITSTFLSIFGSKGQEMKLISWVVDAEVQRTDYASNLFRRNSMATRMLSEYSKLHGREYLTAALKPVLDELLSMQPALSFEIDPIRMSEDDDVAVNLANVKMLVKRLLDGIIGAQGKLPDPLRQVCAIVSKAVAERFPENKVQSVGSFIFLRFICPVIVAPESFHISEPVNDKDLRRGLVLATKVIQNLANNVLFGAKESYMVELNDILRTNITRVDSFIRFISEEGGNTITPAKEPGEVSDYDHLRLHRAIAINFDHIENYRAKSDGLKSSLAAIGTLIGQLGPAPNQRQLNFALISKEKRVNEDDQPAPILPLDTAQFTAQFMAKVESRPGLEAALEVIKQREICYEGGLSKEGRSVVYYISRRVDTGTIDMELLAYHILTVIQNVSVRFFDVLMDLTHFSARNLWDLEWLGRLRFILPVDTFRKIATVHIYNSNTTFLNLASQRFLTVDPNIGKKLVFSSNLDDLFNHIPPSQLRLPQSTITAFKDVVAVHSPVNQLADGRIIPVVFKVLTSCIQISGLEKNLVMGCQATINDVVLFKDLLKVNEGQTDTELTLTISSRNNNASNGCSDSVVLTFVSPKRTTIVRDIVAAKQKFLVANPHISTQDERSLRPGDVPGTLLNMAILNLGSPDPYLRLTSYNLLVAISENFGFNAGNQLLTANGFCIPANNQAFVMDVSRHLAATEKHLTLEFLIECNRSITLSSKDQKLFCLEYMGPWLPTIAEYAESSNPSVLTKLGILLRLVISITIEDTDIFHPIQSKIWAVLSKMPSVVSHVFDAIAETAVKEGVGSHGAEVLVNTVVTLASHQNAGLIARTIISRIIDAAESELFSVYNRKSWTETAIYIRFLLMLSFSNLIDIKQYLPELLHLVTLIVGLGRPFIRNSIHSLVINMIHSLCTLTEIEEDAIMSLREILTSLSGPQADKNFELHDNDKEIDDGDEGEDDEDDEEWDSKLFGSIFACKDALSGRSNRVISSVNLRAVTERLVAAISAGTGDKDLAEQWKALWLASVLNRVPDINAADQSRTFVVLGALSSHDFDVD
ncbi:Neurofibromin 1, partial [Blyttiomyces sp. JEL0837]